MKIAVGIAVALTALALPFAAGAAPAVRHATTTQNTTVFLWNDLTAKPTTNPPTVVGKASLVRSGSGISMTFRTTRLPAGEPITIWWIILEKCDESDRNWAKGMPCSAQYASGRVASKNGTASFSGRLPAGSRAGCFAPKFPCQGLKDPATATVLLLARTHGPKIPGKLRAQLSSSEAVSKDPKADLCPAMNADPLKRRPFCQIQAALFAGS
jgi:hypothetical protein